MAAERATVPLTFLGTGNALAIGRYWNSFLIGGRILVEPSPSVLPNLRLAGADLAAIDTIFISHFHADHTFGWPFLLLEYLLPSQTRRTSDLWVVGPRGVAERLERMLDVGAYPRHTPERGGFDIHYIEVRDDTATQQAGAVRFRAVRVEHSPELECYGYLIEWSGRTIGYSGDTRPCDGLRTLAAASDVLVLECNQRHGPIAVHMTIDDVRDLRAACPDTPFILTHVGPDVPEPAAALRDVRVARDLETIDI